MLNVNEEIFFARSGEGDVSSRSVSAFRVARRESTVGGVLVLVLVSISCLSIDNSDMFSLRMFADVECKYLEGKITSPCWLVFLIAFPRIV